ncbi:MAG TPA: hypothetical protein IAA06_12690 [Candidatus Blautia faecavium]|uniref:Uncharacterized protein n=1 Tax=Candidatus Blautia faecavium TaxID=2838487 RepID=A0A9D2LVQ9_9FIRM|nr:hypothetical protein [Candidatus Blautia faecavium]
MKELRKEMIQALYDNWTDGIFPGTKTDVPEVREAINGITARCKATGTDALYIESTINAAMCAREEAAFTAGFYLCLELLNGNIFKK